MQLHMYAVRVRFVRDARGPLEDKPKRTILSIARTREEASDRARAHFLEMTQAGIVVELGEPTQLQDTIALESLVYV